MDGGRFYIQPVGEQKVASIEQQLASLNLQETPLIGAFNPRKGDIVLAQFTADNSWNRAMVRVNGPGIAPHKFHIICSNVFASLFVVIIDICLNIMAKLTELLTLLLHL